MWGAYHVLPYSPGCVSAGLATWVRTVPGSVRRVGGVLGAVISASAPEVKLPAMPPLALVTRTVQRDSQDPSVTCVSLSFYLFQLIFDAWILYLHYWYVF